MLRQVRLGVSSERCLCSVLFVVRNKHPAKEQQELKDLVLGLTSISDEGQCPWYHSPKLWASVVFIAMVAINVIFW